MNKPNEGETTKPYSNLITMFFAVFIIWIASAILIYFSYSNWADRGTFGDMFGAVNALYSGLAFAALIYTIFMQREEIKMNRQEIVLNRKELKKATVAQQQAQETLKEQVIQTHLTAKINAMSTVINYYNTQIANPNISTELITKAKEKRRVLIRNIDELIDGLNDSDVDE